LSTLSFIFIKNYSKAAVEKVEKVTDTFCTGYAQLAWCQSPFAQLLHKNYH